MDEIRLLNYLKGELSEEEILQVEAWYEASPDNKKMLEQLYYTLIPQHYYKIFFLST